MLAIVQGGDKFDNNSIVFECSDDEFRSMEAVKCTERQQTRH